jgi:hypothetical protein
MELFRGITVFIGWLTGALAGVGAILYAFGYLIAMAQLHLLGIHELFGYGNDHHIQAGGRFLLAIGLMLADKLLSVLVALCVLAVPLVIAYAALSRMRDSLGPVQARWKGRITGIGARWPHLWKAAGYALLLILLFGSAEDPRSFSNPLEVSNLLFQPETSPGAVAHVEQVRQWLLGSGQDSVERLRALFLNCLLSTAKAAVLLLLAWWVTGAWRWRLLLVAPFAIIFMLDIVFLPMLYGVLQQPISFPVVSLDTANPMLAGSHAKLFLLDKSEKAFMVWDQAARRLLWIPSDEVKAAEVRQVELLFHRNARPAGSQ